MITGKIISQVTRKLNEIYTDLSSQILEAINSAKRFSLPLKIHLVSRREENTPHWTINPVGYKGAAKPEMLEKYKIIVRNQVLGSVLRFAQLGRA